MLESWVPHKDRLLGLHRSVKHDGHQKPTEKYPSGTEVDCLSKSAGIYDRRDQQTKKGHKRKLPFSAHENMPPYRAETSDNESQSHQTLHLIAPATWSRSSDRLISAVERNHVVAFGRRWGLARQKIKTI
jgi:hypothetical protein